MASTMLDFPDPVGPTRAKTSAPSKSMTVGSRKDVKPSISRRLGRMGILQRLSLQQLGEEGLHALVVDPLVGEVGGEQLGRRQSLARLTEAPSVGGGAVGGRHDHVDCAREQL